MISAIRKAVFPVAGLGTRFLPATKTMPKEMLTIVDRPLIQYVVEEAMSAGIEEFIFVTARGKTELEDHFDTAYELEATLEKRGKTDELTSLRSWLPEAGSVIYTRQQQPLGLGHAVWCARHIVGNEPFAVLLPDEIILHETSCLKQMVDAYSAIGGNLLAVFDVPLDQTTQYGILDGGLEADGLIEVKNLVEKPGPEAAPSTLSITGRYILQPSIFEHLSGQKEGLEGEIQLTDAMTHMIGDSPFHGYRFQGERYDCGNVMGFLKANIAVALTRKDVEKDLKSYLKSILL